MIAGHMPLPSPTLLAVLNERLLQRTEDMHPHCGLLWDKGALVYISVGSSQDKINNFSCLGNILQPAVFPDRNKCSLISKNVTVIYSISLSWEQLTDSLHLKHTMTLLIIIIVETISQITDCGIISNGTLLCIPGVEKLWNLHKAYKTAASHQRYVSGNWLLMLVGSF